MFLNQYEVYGSLLVYGACIMYTDGALNCRCIVAYAQVGLEFPFNPNSSLQELECDLLSNLRTRCLQTSQICVELKCVD